MEPIGNALNRVVKAPNFAARHDALRAEIIESEKVQQFFSEHASEIDKSVVDRSLVKLHEYKTASDACDKCESHDTCSNILKGFEPKLVLKRGLIEADYIKCPTKLLDDDRRNTYVSVSKEGEQLLLKMNQNYFNSAHSILKASLPIKQLHGKFPEFLDVMSVIRNIYGEEFMEIFELGFKNIDDSFDDSSGQLIGARRIKEDAEV